MAKVRARDRMPGGAIPEPQPAPEASAPPRLPPLRPPDGHEAVDPNKVYRLVSRELTGQRVHEALGADLERMVIDANGNWLVLAEKPPVVPLLRVFDSHGDRDRGTLIWAGINEARSLLRDAGVILVDINGNIRPHGRWCSRQTGWQAWLIFHQRRLKEAKGDE